MRPIRILPLLILGLATPVLAADGVLEINQTCAVQTGCFSGDSAGWPVTISAPGAYVLTSNLSVSDANTTALDVNASRSTIDLRGFSITGPNSCSGTPLSCTANGTGIGIDASGGAFVEVFGGSIVGMGSKGVWLLSLGVARDLRVGDNGGNGIEVGESARVFRNTAIENLGSGIQTANNAVISENTARRNGTSGIAAGDRSTISGNTASANDVDGIAAGFSSSITGNATYQNRDDGIDAGLGVSIIGNTSNGNGFGSNPDDSNGIESGDDGLIRENVVRANSGFGIYSSFDTAYSHNVVVDDNTGTVSGASPPNNYGGNYCAGVGVTTSTCP